MDRTGTATVVGSINLIMFGVKHNLKVAAFNVMFMLLGSTIESFIKNRSKFCNDVQFEVVLQMLSLMGMQNTRIDELSNHHPSILREYCFDLRGLDIIRQYSSIESGKDLIDYVDRIGTIPARTIKRHFNQYTYRALTLCETAQQMHSILSELLKPEQG